MIMCLCSCQFCLSVFGDQFVFEFGEGGEDVECELFIGGGGVDLCVGFGQYF